MPDQQPSIISLLAKHARHEKLSKEELELLEAWRLISGEHRRLTDLLADPQWVEDQLRILDEPSPTGEMWAVLSRRLNFPEDPKPRAAWKRYILAVAALIVFAMAFRWFFFTRYESTANVPNDVALIPTPAANEIVWTLGDGSRINLDSLPVNTALMGGGEPRVQKTAANRLDYDSTVGDTGLGDTRRHYIALGSARKPYSLRLNDGTRVFLRPGAVLGYWLRRGLADTFSISGKAYFEIASNPSKPLILEIPGHNVIEVLGTAFHVDAEEGKQAKVSLFSGKVKVLNRTGSLLLKPYEEVLLAGDTMRRRTLTDSTTLMAWADEARVFRFGHSTSLREAIQQVAAFYGYTVSSPENIDGAPIAGNIPNSGSIDDVLMKIRLIGNKRFYFWEEGRKLHISSKPRISIRTQLIYNQM